MRRDQVQIWDIHTFLDDLTVATQSVPGGRWILKELERLMGWAKMFKPRKSRSLVLKDKVVDKLHFSISGTLPSLRSL